LDEYLDILLERPLDDLGARCNPGLPDGLRMLEWEPVSEPVPKLSADVTAARYEVALDTVHLTERPQWTEFMARSSAGDRSASVGSADALEQDLRARLPRETTAANGEKPEPSLLDIHVGEHGDELRIEYVSTMHHGRSIFPDVLEPYFGNPRTDGIPMRIVRKELFVERNGALLSPINKGVVQNRL
jgi:hypothetical protein